jgi:hypothetical protein
MHSAESSTQTTPTQSSGHGEREDKTSGKQTPILPEDIGKQTAMYLIEEIVKVQIQIMTHFSVQKIINNLRYVQGGCADRGCQIIPLLFMALGQKDISKIQLGELSTYT